MLLDSTRSFGDGLNANVIAYPTTQAYQQPRLQFSARDSRLGFKAQAPEISGITGDAVIEMDFFANGPTINAGGGASGQAAGSGYTTEGSFFSNPGIRIRHAYLELKSPVVNILAGQSWHVLGWQNYFFPGTPAWLGVPNEIFNRTAQLRLSHTFESDAVNFDIVAAAFRPVQRDSAIPDVEGGIRLAINHWKGITTPGSGGTGARAAAIGVSGLARWFRVDPYAPLPAPPIQLVGWAAAGHILLPVVPVKDSTDRGNALTITGEAVIGTADADQYGMTAGATMPNVNQLSIASTNAALTSTPASAGNAPIVGTPYTPDVDPGLVAFDSSGILHTINWQSFLVGVQYYLPPSGRVFITGNYSQGYSSNIASLFHPDSPRQPWVSSPQRVPAVVVRRREPLVRRHASSSNRAFLPVRPAGARRCHDGPQPSRRDGVVLLLLSPRRRSVLARTTACACALRVDTHASQRCRRGPRPARRPRLRPGGAPRPTWRENRNQRGGPRRALPAPTGRRACHR